MEALSASTNTWVAQSVFFFQSLTGDTEILSATKKIDKGKLKGPYIPTDMLKYNMILLTPLSYTINYL